MKIKKSLDKGKIIENNIDEINKMNENLEKFNLNQEKIIFIYNENEILEKILNFGKAIENSNFNSDIINLSDFLKINEWMGKNNKYMLKYSAKKDGCNTDIFHKKCDDISGILFICKVADREDVIGGYMSTKIQKKDDDDKAFIFNLTKNIIKRNKNSIKNSIKNFTSSYLIKFGSHCDIFSISENCLNDKSSYVKYCLCGGAGNYDCYDDNLLSSGRVNINFKVENFEVFQVL